MDESVVEMVAKILLFHHDNYSQKSDNGDVIEKMNKEFLTNVSNDFRNDIVDVIEVDGILDHFIVDIFLITLPLFSLLNNITVF